MIFRHVVIKARFLHESLAADRAHLPPVPRVYPLVEAQRGPPQKRFLAEPTVIVPLCFVLELVLVHTLEAERLVIAKIALVFLAHHMKVVHVLPQLDLAVENALASVTIDAIVYVVLAELMHRERGRGHKALRASRTLELRYLIVLRFDVVTERAVFVVAIAAVRADNGGSVARIVVGADAEF